MPGKIFKEGFYRRFLRTTVWPLREKDLFALVATLIIGYVCVVIICMLSLQGPMNWIATSGMTVLFAFASYSVWRSEYCAKRYIKYQEDTRNRKKKREVQGYLDKQKLGAADDSATSGAQ